MEKMLKIVGSVTEYSTSNTWEKYKTLILPLKQAILKEEIKVISSKYDSDFNKEYYPYTKEKSWGSNLNEYTLTLDSKFNCELRYYKINNFSEFFNRTHKFTLTFKLPKKFLPLFKNAIESNFHYKCMEIYQQEVKTAEEKRIKEIGNELLNKN